MHIARGLIICSNNSGYLTQPGRARLPVVPVHAEENTAASAAEGRPLVREARYGTALLRAKTGNHDRHCAPAIPLGSDQPYPDPLPVRHRRALDHVHRTHHRLILDTLVCHQLNRSIRAIFFDHYKPLSCFSRSPRPRRTKRKVPEHCLGHFALPHRELCVYLHSPFPWPLLSVR